MPASAENPEIEMGQRPGARGLVGVGAKRRPRDNEGEVHLERLVSGHIGKISVIWLNVPGRAAADSGRAFLERNLVQPRRSAGPRRLKESPRGCCCNPRPYFARRGSETFKGVLQTRHISVFLSQHRERVQLVSASAQDLLTSTDPNAIVATPCKKT